MRRILVLALAVVTLLAVTAPAAFAQPTFKINGLIDTVTSWSKNMRNSNYTLDNDTEWYVRNRARLNFTGEVGKAKGVVALEYDLTWGQTGAADNATSSQLAGAAAGQRPGTTGGMDLNVDVQHVTELKWLYAEFPVPLVPFPTTMRIGAQPFSETFKLATLATGDFSGLTIDSTLSPNVKWSFTYVAVEEKLVGGGTGINLNRGDDYAIITNLTVTPMKGLDIRPIYAYFHAQRSTNGAARPGVFGPVAGIANEDRHTFGVDMRWRSGPFSVDPTFFYQTGEIERAGGLTTDISAWLVDILAGWRTGPLLLEVRGVYISGNSASDNLNGTSDLKYYQPISADTSYMADGWAAITGLGLEYFNNLAAPVAMGSPLSFDRYGRAQIGGKATYSVTPAVDFYGVVNAIWTAKKVGLVAVSPGGALPANSRWVGVELIYGVDYRFVPGVAFGVQAAHLFSGDALKSTGVAGRDPENVHSLAARVRFTF